MDERTEENELLNNPAIPLTEMGSEALVAVRNSSVALQTSIIGWTSLFNFDKVEAMSVDTFMEKRLPEFKKDANQLCVYRDTPTNSVGVLYDDFAAVFHLTSVEDIDQEALRDLLNSNRRVSITPNTGMYKLVYYCREEGGDVSVTLEIPEAQFCFHHVSTALAGWAERPIWHPKLWLNMRLTASNVLRAAFIAVVVQDAPDAKDVVLGEFLLPNCDHSGSICFGSTTAEVSGTTFGAIGYSVYHQYIDSKFNNDLFDPSRVNARLCDFDMSASCALEKLLMCMENHETMVKIPWPRIDNCNFIGGSRYA